MISSILISIPFASVGDETVAYRLERNGDFTNLAADVILVRQGDAVMLLTHVDQSFGPPTIDSRLTAQLAQRAADLLAVIASAP